MSNYTPSLSFPTVPTFPVDTVAIIQYVVVAGSLICACLLLLSPPLTAESFPWAGGYKQPVSKRVAPFHSLFVGRRLLQESYDQFCKNGITCILPGIFGNQVALPPKLASWMLEQPDAVLSAKHAQADAVEATVTMLSPDVALKPFHEDTVRRRLKRNLEDLHEGMIDEVVHATKAEFGSDGDEFRRVNLDSAVRRIVAKVSNRVFVGESLCRNQHFIDNAIAYTHDIPVSGLIIKLFPGFIQPIISQLAIILNKLHFRRCASYLQPMLEERIDMYSGDPESMPENFLSWLVQDSMKRKVPTERTSLMMARRLMALNFASIHTSTMTTVNLLLDVISGPAGASCLEDLLKEYQALSETHGSSWTRKRLDDMVVTDSALRESMRLSGFQSRLFARKVISKAGVSLPDGGHVPSGATVFIPGHPLHHDPEIYPEPFSFKYDRFQEKPPAAAASVDETEQQGTAGKSAVMTELSYGIWGHGRHACPGRFFAVDLIKMVVGHLVEQYEIKQLDQRPESLWVVDTPIPPRDFCVEIRKRSV